MLIGTFPDPEISLGLREILGTVPEDRLRYGDLQVVLDRGNFSAHHTLNFRDHPIGTFSLKLRADYEVHVEFTDVVPEGIQPRILERLAPLRDVLRIAVRDRKDFETRVEQDADELFGPPDHNRVSGIYAGPKRALHDLLFGGVVEEVFGRPLLVKPIWSSTGFVYAFSYVQDNYEVPAFRIKDVGTQVHVLGNGNRDRARLGYVSAALDAAQVLCQERAAAVTGPLEEMRAALRQHLTALGGQDAQAMNILDMLNDDQGRRHFGGNDNIRTFSRMRGAINVNQVLGTDLGMGFRRNPSADGRKTYVTHENTLIHDGEMTLPEMNNEHKLVVNMMTSDNVFGVNLPWGDPNNMPHDEEATIRDMLEEEFS